METDFERCFKRLGELAADHKPGDPANEATTRLRMIDVLLFECLGWDRADCVAEEHHDGAYADYVLHTPARALIFEAKREGNYFELPAGLQISALQVESIGKLYPQLHAAITQAAGYCGPRGVPIGAVTNGHQVAVFLGSRLDGTTIDESRALLFPSLTEMRRNFLLLWDCVSRPGAMARLAYRHLTGDDAAPAPPKLSARILNYPGVRRRNELQVSLAILAEMVLADLGHHDEMEFLTRCYSRSGALSQYAMISKAIITSRYPAAFDGIDNSPTLTPVETRQGKTNILDAPLSRRPALLLGDVGVGKTMFIRHLIRVEAREIAQRSVLIYLDLGVHPTLAVELRPWLAATIITELRINFGIDVHERSFVHGVYHGDLERFDRGIYGALKVSNATVYEAKRLAYLEDLMRNAEHHLRKSLDHITKARGRPVAIFLDNVDQRPYEFQQEAFLLAQSIAETWPASVFVAMRPETFYRSKTEGVLSAYHAQAFTVSPPRVDRVLDLRIEYAIEKLNAGVLPGVPGVAVRLGAITEYLKVIRDSFKRNKGLVSFIDNISGSNVRVALDLVQTFIGSGHVDTEKILAIAKSPDGYAIGTHEFIRAVIYGDYEHFDPRNPRIVNLFDTQFAVGRSHFSLPCMLAATESLGGSPGSDGYVEYPRLLLSMQDVGFTEREVASACARALRTKLLEAPERLAAQDVGKDLCVRITSAGAYHYKVLISIFAYFDAMTVDTPILSDGARSRISVAAGIRDRLLRAEVFADYLDTEWRSCEAAKAYLPWPRHTMQLREEIARIGATL